MGVFYVSVSQRFLWYIKQIDGKILPFFLHKTRCCNKLHRQFQHPTVLSRVLKQEIEKITPVWFFSTQTHCLPFYFVIQQCITASMAHIIIGRDVFHKWCLLPCPDLSFHTMTSPFFSILCLINSTIFINLIHIFVCNTY